MHRVLEGAMKGHRIALGRNNTVWVLGGLRGSMPLTRETVCAYTMEFGNASRALLQLRGGQFSLIECSDRMEEALRTSLDGLDTLDRFHVRQFYQMPRQEQAHRLPFRLGALVQAVLAVLVCIFSLALIYFAYQIPAVRNRAPDAGGRAIRTDSGYVYQTGGGERLAAAHTEITEGG